MASTEESVNHPTSHEMTAHARDYSRFITMFKWGAVVSFLIGFIVVFFVL